MKGGGQKCHPQLKSVAIRRTKKIATNDAGQSADR